MDGDLFDQFLVVGIEGVEAVNLVMFCLVGGRVSKNEEGVKFGKRVNGLLAFHFLWLVEDQDRVVGAENIDGAA